MKIDFYQKVREAEAEIKSYYIHLHRHPELSGQEYKTQDSRTTEKMEGRVQALCRYRSIRSHQKREARAYHCPPRGYGCSAGDGTDRSCLAV